MFAFTIVWLGQVISLIGTAMSGFALTIWAWQLTGSATALALVGFFNFGPTVLLSPVAGALVDRWNRKLVMMLSDLAAGLSTLVILLLYATGRLEIWHLYVAGAFSGAFQAFQFPAYSASISLMMPKEQYTRANGMIFVADFGSGIFAPVLAALLLGVIGIGGVLAVDIVTFVVAIGALLFVHIPQPAVTEEGRAGRGSLWKESLYGFRYILARPSLLGLQLVFFTGNLMGGFGWTLFNPMILARTSSNAAVLGSVQSAFGAGGLAGSLLMIAWGGPKRRVHGVLFGHVLIGLLLQGLIGLGRGLPVWLPAAFLGMAVMPIINGSSQAIWQAKVAPDVQGRVFSARRLISQISSPISMLLAGPLADRVFEPGMQAGTALAGSFGWLVGTGPGAGMALIILITGLLTVAAGFVGYAFPAIRNAEDILPDHKAEIAEEPGREAAEAALAHPAAASPGI